MNTEYIKNHCAPQLIVSFNAVLAALVDGILLITILLVFGASLILVLHISKSKYLFGYIIAFIVISIIATQMVI
jgi:hypothetical protein